MPPYTSINVILYSLLSMAGITGFLPTIHSLLLSYSQNLNFIQGGKMLSYKYFPVSLVGRNNPVTASEM